MSVYDRAYEPVALALNHVAGSRDRRMREVADTLWRFFRHEGVSWVGFYTIDDDQENMILGPSRDTPACSPIGMHGTCGKSWRTGRPMIIGDVVNLGPEYIACDPRDKSELVIPMFCSGGKCWGVLDVDSRERDAFGEADMFELRKILEATGLSWPKAHLDAIVY
ncbi:MAG: GAF domain-containing protein [Phycisphaerales bacterium]|nr:GAF domain-containing protein [Phycisphaerales bacterium]